MRLLKIFYVLARVIICYLFCYVVVKMKPSSRESQHSVKYRGKGTMPRRGLGLRLPSVSVDPLKDTIMSCAIRLRRFSRPVAPKDGVALRRYDQIAEDSASLMIPGMWHRCSMVTL